MLYDLQNVHDLDVFPQTAKKIQDGRFEIQGLLSEKQIEKIHAAGYDVEIVKDAGDVAKERLKDVDR